MPRVDPQAKDRTQRLAQAAYSSAATSTERMIDCIAMKTAKTKKPATSEEYERFEKFAKALMAVPKKELDKELAKSEKGKDKKSSRHRRHGSGR